MIVRKKQLPGNPVKNWMNPRVITATELDYMEYASDGAAQAAYVTDGTYTADLLSGGTASADNVAFGAAANACDGAADYWSTTDVSYPHWWKYDFGAGVTKRIQRITLHEDATLGGWRMKDFILQGSNDDSDWTNIYTGQHANNTDVQTFSFSNANLYRYYRLYFAGPNWNGANNYCGATEIEMMERSLQCYSESTIITQGTYSLKGIATTDAVDDTLTRTIGSPIDLTGVDDLIIDVYASRTGSNIKIGIHDSGGTTTETTPNITDANTWQTVVWDISGVADANKDAIDSLIFTIVNADSANTFCIDNFLGNSYSIKMYEDDPVVNAGDPIGTLLLWPTGTPPSGYLECDGSSLDRTTYALLFAVLSDDYGAVDGDHFSLPDMRGKFFRGWSHGQTTDPDKATRTDRGDTTTGDNVGTNQAHGVKAHTHTAMASASSAGSTGASSPAQNTTTDSGAYGGNETRPINIAMMCCIRYQ